MSRRTPLCLAATLLIAAGAQRAQPPQNTLEPGPNRKAVLNYHAAQASLYTALAYANALEALAAMAKSEDMDLARSYIHTIDRQIQGVNDSSVKVGQAMHEVEKNEHLKTLRAELAEASKAADKVQDAVDGLGVLAPHAKNVSGHLLNATIAIVKLAEAVGVEPLPPPGAMAFQEGRQATRRRDNASR
jgi:hypothetical protein